MDAVVSVVVADMAVVDGAEQLSMIEVSRGELIEFAVFLVVDDVATQVSDL